MMHVKWSRHTAYLSKEIIHESLTLHRNLNIITTCIALLLHTHTHTIN